MNGSTNAQRPPTDLSSVVNITASQTVTGAKDLQAGLISKDVRIEEYAYTSRGENGLIITFRRGQSDRSFQLFYILDANNKLNLVVRKTINGVDTYQSIFSV